MVEEPNTSSRNGIRVKYNVYVNWQSHQGREKGNENI